jgi:hypothetical protein
MIAITTSSSTNVKARRKERGFNDMGSVRKKKTGTPRRAAAYHSGGEKIKFLRNANGGLKSEMPSSGGWKEKWQTGWRAAGISFFGLIAIGAEERTRNLVGFLWRGEILLARRASGAGIRPCSILRKAL